MSLGGAALGVAPLGGRATSSTPPVTVAGSLVLAGTASAVGGGPSTGSLTFSGTVTASTRGTAAGALTLAGTATPKASGLASGSLSLAGLDSASVPGSGSGSLSLAGSAGPSGSGVATGSLVLAATGAAFSQAAALASGSLSLAGAAESGIRGSATGSLSLVGDAEGDGVSTTATGLLSLLGAVGVSVPSDAMGGLSLGSAAAGGFGTVAMFTCSVSMEASGQVRLSAHGALVLAGVVDVGVVVSAVTGSLALSIDARPTALAISQPLYLTMVAGAVPGANAAAAGSMMLAAYPIFVDGYNGVAVLGQYTSHFDDPYVPLSLLGEEPGLESRHTPSGGMRPVIHA